MNKLLIRTASGAVYVAIIITIIYLGEWLQQPKYGLPISALFFGVLAMVGCREVYHNLQKKNIPINTIAGYILGIVCYLGIFIDIGLSPYILIPCFFLLTMLQLFRHEEEPFATIGYTFLPILWVVAPLALLPYLIYEDAGYTMLVFALIWVNDSFAYLCGSAFGKHKMTRHSPNKTWEGTVGGAVVCILVSIFLGHLLYEDGDALLFALLGVIVAVFGTLGDLVESMFKRFVGVKDSGRLLPGHGGLLDRFDSLLAVLPFAYILFELFT